MQQLQEKSAKIQQNSNIEDRYTFEPSPFPTILGVAGKVFYGLSGVSLVASLFAWNRVFATPASTGKRSQKGIVNKSSEYEQRAYQESQRLGTYIGLWTPTFVAIGHVLEYAGERLARYEYYQWEKQQGFKGYSPDYRSHFYNR
jgi:hypothetical protein